MQCLDFPKKTHAHTHVRASLHHYSDVIVTTTTLLLLSSLQCHHCCHCHCHCHHCCRCHCHHCHCHCHYCSVSTNAIRMFISWFHVSTLFNTRATPNKWDGDRWSLDATNLDASDRLQFDHAGWNGNEKDAAWVDRMARHSRPPLPANRPPVHAIQEPT